MYYNTVMFRVISEILPLEEPVIVKSILSFLIATPIKSECNNMICYTVKGHLHRHDGPAIIHSNGDTEWFQYGKRHRLNGPAVIMIEMEQWFQFGLLHRLDGPAVIETFTDISKWCVNGRLHRENDKPAYKSPLELQWRKDGKLHRENGPARIQIFYDKSCYKTWYIVGVQHKELCYKNYDNLTINDFSSD